MEADLLDAAGNSVALSQVFEVTATVPNDVLFTTPAKSAGGLRESFVNQSLRSYAAQDDWRATQSISGTRVEPVVDFRADGWGGRSEVGLTGGIDANWDNFSTQWDGVIEIHDDGVRLFTQSSDASRMWIDVNLDGTFNASGDEFVNSNWGSGLSSARRRLL